MHAELAGLFGRGWLGLQTRRSLLVLCAVRLVASMDAQVALSSSLAGEAAARNRRILREMQPYSFKVGVSEFRLSAGAETEWNDNITLVERDKTSDVILRPRVGTDIIWPITPANALELNVSAGYSKYLSHPEYDRPFILPGSALSFDLFLGDVKLTIDDRLSYQQDSASRSVVAGTARFGGIDNLAGLTAVADLKDVTLSFAYHHQLFSSTVSEFDYLDRSSHQFFSRASLAPRPGFRVGVEAGLTPTTYRDSFLRDNLNYSAGGFTEWTVSPHISLHARGGVVLYRYATQSGSAPDPGVTSYYFGFGATHRLRKSLNHSLDLGEDTQLGVNNDLTRQLHVRYGMNWLVSRQVSAMGDLSFEDGTESGSLRAETFSRLGFSLGVRWQWATRWNSRLSWSLAVRDSDRISRGYENHRVILEVGYQR